MRVFLCFFCILFAAPAVACMGPGLEDHHYPSCTIPPPTKDETVTVLQSARTFASNVHVGYAKKRTDLRVILVGPSHKKHYLILESDAQTIWQFKGDVSSISRVIALGAKTIGPDATGVIGLPADKVHFTAPDLAFQQKMHVISSCDRIFSACTVRQWYDTADKRITFYPERAQSPFLGDRKKDHHRGELERGTGVFTFVRPEVWPDLIEIKTDDVVSMNPAKRYRRVPGAGGLQEMVDQGILATPGSRVFETTLDTFSETFSARFRSRFDPNFLFRPDVDYVVTEEATLPPDLPPVRLLTAPGVPMPDFGDNRHYARCAFVFETAPLPIEFQDFGSHVCAARERRDEKSGVEYASNFDAYAPGDQSVDLPKGSHIAVVALTEGRNRRYRGDAARQVDIEVARSGPVALFLAMDGGAIHWNIIGPDVVGVFVPRIFDVVPFNKVTLNGAGYTPTVLSAPREPNRLGPAIALLDRVLHAELGQKIDSLLIDEATPTSRSDPPERVPAYMIK